MDSKLDGNLFTAPGSGRTDHGGFTLTELLVVIATVGILGVLVLPTLGFSKARPQAVVCLNNFNQLAKACAMYTGDNQQFYPPNPDDGGTQPGYEWCAGDVSGWTAPIPSPDDSIEAGDATYITNSKYSLLAPYLASNGVPFKCPTDWRLYNYQGTIVPVVRSVSANAGVGTVDISWLDGGGHSGIPRTPVGAGWLTGNDNERQTSYATFGSTSDFRNCSPSDIFVYEDEDPLSINDASLGVVAATPEVVDYPSVRHQNGAGFAFCDGHTEMHKWKSNVFLLTGYANIKTVPSGPEESDWYWLAWHASRSLTTGTVP
jgi:prepilin-type processing-associated H-X9-DG protein/prepilin-type N-terminal cleavage/methylation domain-containing protein